MGEIRKTIGENIKRICALKGIRQVEIAEHLNVSQGSVSNWIKGTNSIDIENLAELCRFIGVSLDQIYGMEPITPEVSLSGDETELVAIYRSLHADGRNLLMNIARAFSGNPTMQTVDTDGHDIQSILRKAVDRQGSQNPSDISEARA